MCRLFLFAIVVIASLTAVTGCGLSPSGLSQPGELLNVTLDKTDFQRSRPPKIAFRPRLAGGMVTVKVEMMRAVKRPVKGLDENPEIRLEVLVGDSLIANQRNKFNTTKSRDYRSSDEKEVIELRMYGDDAKLFANFYPGSAEEHVINFTGTEWCETCHFLVTQVK